MKKNTNCFIPKKSRKKLALFGGGLLVLLLLPILLIEIFLLPPQREEGPPLPKIKVLMEDGVKEIGLEDFLLGVIAGEMPAAFPLEALKAQAIAARTYIYIHSPLNTKGDKSRHQEAAVCCDSTHCQAYLDESGRKERWGNKTKEYEKKIRQAIKQTQGMIITYQGEAVEAPYFSTCGGKTESAQDLWGNACPYLVSVECHWDKEAPNYQSREVFALKEAAALLGVSAKAVSAMAELEKTSGGRVAMLKIGNKNLTGSQIRGLLGLKSAAFTWEIAQDEIAFYVSGYGHGVGMCQFGAGGMAKAGYNYEEILKHYYTGVEIQKIY